MLIDRFEEGVAVCEAEDGVRRIEPALLEAGLQEGDAIYFDGLLYRKDEALTAARRSVIASKMQRLRKFKR